MRAGGVWVADGTIGAGERITVSTRAAAGPLRVTLLTAPTPASRLRAFCGLTGFPAILPEWSYGFWKSRDVHEHRDDVLADFDGFRRNGIPLDAIVIDSPWGKQYNTWEFNPHQFPDAAWMVGMLGDAGVRTVLWVTPWVNLDSRDGQIPPQPEPERLHSEPAPNHAPAARAGHLVREPDGEPFVTRWWMGTGSPVDFTSRLPRSGGASRPSARSTSSPPSARSSHRTAIGSRPGPRNLAAEAERRWRPRRSTRSRSGASRGSAIRRSGLAGGTRIAWRRGRWSVDGDRTVSFAQRGR